jgi:hypothetical protein
MLPGTTIETVVSPGAADRQLTPLFSCGGLVLSQVCQLTGLEGYTIQNWIKRKFLSPPVKKKYTRSQLCRIININLLKDTFTLEQAVTLLGYVSGNISGNTGGTADDLIDDSRLYTYLVDCLAALNYSDSLDLSCAGETVREIAADYNSSHRGVEIRLWLVLEIMLTACHAQQIHHRALEMFGRIDNM